MSTTTAPRLPRGAIRTDADYPARTHAGVSLLDASRVVALVNNFLSGGGVRPLMSQSTDPSVPNGAIGYPPGFHESCWSVAYEGEYDWPFYFMDWVRKARAGQVETTPVQRALLDAVAHVDFDAGAGWRLSIYVD